MVCARILSTGVFPMAVDFTKWTCRGTDRDRTCLYQNLYFANGTLVAFVGPGDHHREFEPVQLCGTSRDWCKNYWMPARVPFDSLDELRSHVARLSVDTQSTLAVFFATFGDNNIGHALFDGLYPPYHALAKLGMQTEPFLPLLTGGSAARARSIYGQFAGRQAMHLDELKAKSWSWRFWRGWRAHATHFTQLVVGCGGVGNMYAEPDVAIGGHGHVMKSFRNRMWQAYGVSPMQPRTSKRTVDVVFVHNKRYSPNVLAAINRTVSLINGRRYAHAEYIDWAHVGSGDYVAKFRAHLQRASRADVYVSSIGTALQYVPFLRDQSVFVNVGTLWKREGRIFPCFMEQQLAGGGTPYLQTLYADVHRALGTPEAVKMQGEYLVALDEADLSAKIKLAIDLLSRPMSGKPSPYANLSPEGHILAQLCHEQPDACAKLTDSRNSLLNATLKGRACRTMVWPEWPVYELAGWEMGASGGCEGLNRNRLRQLRAKHGLPDLRLTYVGQAK